MKTIHVPRFLTLFALLGANLSLSLAEPLGTAISYQGRLNQGGSPAQGRYDFRYAIYDAITNGNVIGGVITNTATPVTDGLFATALDFGNGIFTGDARWLEISVRSNGVAADFTVLTPRQLLIPTPYALYAPSAGVASVATAANATAANAVNATSLQADSVTTDKILNGTITDGDINASGISGDKIVGGDLQAQRLKVGQDHTLSGTLATIAGGQYNKAAGEYATVSGGWANEARALRSTVGGGATNVVSNQSATISGGEQNWVAGDYGTIAGGVQNRVTGNQATVGGGDNNTASGFKATIGGGNNNTVEGYSSFIGGGEYNQVDGDASVIAGGIYNLVRTNAGYDFIGGGSGNQVGTNSAWNVVAGGRDNTIAPDTYFAAIPGGWSNTVAGSYGFAAGRNAKVQHYGSFVWADAQDSDFASTAHNQFSVRASGGVRFETGGAGLTVGGPITAPTLEVAGGVAYSGQLAKLDVATNSTTATIRAHDLLLGYPSRRGEPGRALVDNGEYLAVNWGADWTNTVIDGHVILDPGNSNTGGLARGLSFGLPSGEGIASKRDSGGNQWGLDFYTGYQPRMSIDNHGNVGIGTASPTVALEVAGTVKGTAFIGDGSQLTGIATATPPPGMALIPAGAFTMGDTLDGLSDATPTVSVTVSAFYMDMHEVTLSQWQSVYYWATNHGYGFVHAGAGKGANHPVQTVDWYDCVKWCNARSQQAGRTPVYYTDAGLTQVYTNGEPTTLYPNWAAKGYRLPTEAEWEKAARGGLSGQRFPWGNVINQNLGNYYGFTGSYAYDLGPDGYNPIGSIGGTSPATSPVGSFAANGYGLCDMAGNVYEWCWDWYGTPYAGGSDPRGPASGTYRMFRGGGWDGGAHACRSAYRNGYYPSYHDYYVGFRSVLPSGQ